MESDASKDLVFVSTPSGKAPINQMLNTVSLVLFVVLVIGITWVGLSVQRPPALPVGDSNSDANFFGNLPDPVLPVSNPEYLCGNSVCETGENVNNCLLDCWVCNANGVCESEIGENSNSCKVDCPALPVCNSNDCGSRPVCGDSVIETPEVCDKEKLNGTTCRSFGFKGGTLLCASDCRSFDVKQCILETPPVYSCGNGIIEGFESCDSSDLNSQTCGLQGFAGGSLSCKPDCSGFDVSQCNSCGNDACEAGETALTCPSDCAGVCGDQVCGKGEGTDNCPWDCLIASQSDIVKIQFPAYNVTKVQRFHLDGTVSEVTDPMQIHDFLLDKLDFSIRGLVFGSELLSQSSNRLPVVEYAQTYTVYENETWVKEVWDAIKDNENAFAHARNHPVTRENRLRHRCYFTGYLINPETAWREALADYSKALLSKNQNLDGIFLDNALGRIVTANRFIRWVSSESQTVGSDGKTIDLPDENLHTPQPYYACENDITAFDNPDQTGTDFFAGGSYSKNQIVLGTPVEPYSTVYVSYRALSEPDQAFIDAWPQRMSDTISFVRAAIKPKLTVFNGIIYSWTEDDSFPSLTDGGMDEQFVASPWTAPIGSWLSGATWKKQLDELNSISKTRIYLAQGRLRLPDANRLNPSDPDTIQMKKVASYSFATFLLGNQRFAFFHFGLDPGPYQTYVHFDAWDTNVGQPREEYHLRSGTVGVYEREYQNVLVLVNSGTVTETVSLAGTFYTLSGAPVSSIAMEAKSGVLLKRNP